MALSPAECLVPEVSENEALIVELLEQTIDLYLSTGLRSFDVTPERQRLFDATLRAKYQKAGWYLVYRPMGVAGWHILFAPCGPDDRNAPATTPLTARIGRPMMAQVPTVTKAGEVGAVVVDGSQNEFAPIPTYPARMVTQPAAVDAGNETEPFAEDAPEPPKRESKRG